MKRRKKAGFGGYRAQEYEQVYRPTSRNAGIGVINA